MLTVLALSIAFVQEPAPVQTPAAAKHLAELARDRKQGEEYTKQVEKEFQFSKDADLQARVDRVAADLIKIAQTEQVEATWGDKRLNPFDYKFTVIIGEDVNAFSLPGGFIYIYDGLLKFAESDDELAGVIAHEIAHASLRHVNTLERESRKLQNFTLPLILASIFSNGNETATGLGTLAQLGSLSAGSGWSIKAEEAADYAAIQYLRKSKYHPVGALTFMERLGRQQIQYKTQNLGIFQTHPPSKARADHMSRRLKQFEIPVRRSLVSPAYRAVTQTNKSGVHELTFDGRVILSYGGEDAEARAREDVLSLNAFLDTVPNLYDVDDQPDGTITGYGRPIMKISPDDARAAGISVEELTSKTVAALKKSVYVIAFRIWEGN